MRTRVTEILRIEHPVLSAGIPIIGVDLVAAVSRPEVSVSWGRPICRHTRSTSASRPFASGRAGRSG